MLSKWTKWQDFTDDNLLKIPEHPGVYRIRCLEVNGKKAKEIKRLLGTDSEGILSIGESGDLKTRLKAFWKSSHGNNYHAAAWHYWAFRYNKKFPHNFLQFCYTKASAKGKKGKDEAIKLEFTLLLKYRKKFLDGPPLNVNRGKYPENYRGLFKKIIGKEPPK